MTALPIVPPIAVLLAKDPLVFDYDLSSLIDVICGAASLKKETTDEIKKRLNFTVAQGINGRRAGGLAGRLAGRQAGWLADWLTG